MITQIIQPVTGLLYQLQDLLETLTDGQYSEKVPLLSNASIGQHMRHIIEFFLELEKGYYTGMVNYDRRERDYAIETQRGSALNAIASVISGLKNEDAQLTLMADFGEENADLCMVTTSYERELVYNLEHTIHHMALLRIGVKSVSLVELPENFGVAISTLKYRKACAQ
jgi:hypothetical protein